MPNPPNPEDVWSAADYAPTAARLAPVATIVADLLAESLRDSAPSQDTHVIDVGAGHGHVTERLMEHGLQVTAVDPALVMIHHGQRKVPGATWVHATGEKMGLPSESAAGIASSFGAIFCDLHAGPAEWHRVSAPGAALVISAWDNRGFLAEMTRRMMAIMAPDAPPPPHMQWGEDDIATQRLAPYFERIEIEHRDLEWNFPSLEAGMELYTTGSPSHAWSMKRVGKRQEELLTALHNHLSESADSDGAIRATAGYSLIRAWRQP